MKRRKTQHLDLSQPIDPANLSPNMRRLLDALSDGALSIEQVITKSELTRKQVQGLIGRAVAVELVTHGTHKNEFILGKRAPQRRMRGDGQSDDCPLLDYVPVNGRVDLAHMSIRAAVQLFYTQMRYHLSIRRMFDPILEPDDYDRFDDKVRKDVDDLRKCMRAENEINPGLAVDCVSLLIPGLNMPALDAQGRVITTEAEKDGNIDVVDSLMAKPKESK